MTSNPNPTESHSRNAKTTEMAKTHHATRITQLHDCMVTVCVCVCVCMGDYAVAQSEKNKPEISAEGVYKYGAAGVHSSQSQTDVFVECVQYELAYGH